MAESTAEEKPDGHAVTLSNILKAQTQHLLAALGMAEGQCEGCGTYRLDGMPPILHRSGCPSDAGWRG